QMGIENLIILSDFDQTITGFGTKEAPQPASFGIIRKSKHVSPNFNVELTRLFEKYQPYEHNMTIDQNLKLQMIEEWNCLVQKIFNEEKISKSQINDSLNVSNLRIRYFFKELIGQCKEINLPFYIISGGLSPIIASCMEELVGNPQEYPNLFIFCNEGYFNEEEKLHKINMVVNTNSKQLLVSKKQFNLRKNVFLFGDYQHDIFMKKDTECENAVCVMFVRENLDQNEISVLKNEWDALIVGEGNFILHQMLLNFVSGGQFFNFQEEFNQEEQNLQEIKDIIFK
ncbi:hypothetical protein IMG5_046970, partial [Ichthyophthirius multifiliis]